MGSSQHKSPSNTEISPTRGLAWLPMIFRSYTKSCIARSQNYIPVLFRISNSVKGQHNQGNACEGQHLIEIGLHHQRFSLFSPW